MANDSSDDDKETNFRLLGRQRVRRWGKTRRELTRRKEGAERNANLRVRGRAWLHVQVLSALLRGQRARDARSGQRHQVFHRQDVDAHHSITAGDRQMCAVRRPESNAGDLTGRAEKCLHFPAGCDVPYLDGRVFTAGRERLAVWAEGEGLQTRLVAGQGERFRSGGSTQILAVASQLAVASRVPSGLKATSAMVPVWPRRVKSDWPVAASQMMTLASWEPLVANRLPLGLKATPVTSPACPARLNSS